MPRRPRLELPGVPLHVTHRGVNRAATFLDDEDFAHYRRHLGDALAARGFALHAYVLMTNHVHLLLTPPAPGLLSAAMRQLDQHYVPVFNRRHRRTGTLWEGRFKSCLVDSERYLFAVHRYIELNPVRAGMVTDPGQYRWSSYRANGLGQPDARLTPHLLYLAQGRGADERVQAYRALFRPHLDAEAAVDIRQALQLGMPVGQDRFAELVCARAGVRFNSGKRGRPEGKAKDEMSPIAGQRDFGF